MQVSKHWPAMGLALAYSCAVTAGEARLAEGVWGGDNAILTVAADGADVEFECAHGRIAQPIRIDGKGDFDLAGTYEAETPGPSRDDGPPPAPARYQGAIRGDTLTLVVSRADQGIGSYSLTRGRAVVLRKCR
jgi:hypothetical protein